MAARVLWARTFRGTGHRLVDLIHSEFSDSNCKVDLSLATHPRVVQYYIKRFCLGPCLEGLTTRRAIDRPIHEVQLFLEGRPTQRCLEQS